MLPWDKLRKLKSLLGVSGPPTVNNGFLVGDTSTGFWTQKTLAQVKTLLNIESPLNYAGAINCSSNPNYPAATVGDVYMVSVAGKIGGGAGLTVEAGDMIVCNTTTVAGDQATVGSRWNIVQYNIDLGAIVITGGTIDGTTLGLTTPAQARIQLDEIIKTATGNLSAAELSGTIINNFGQTDDCALTLPAAAEGLHFTVSLGTTVAKYYRFIPATGATIALDGSSTGADKYVQIASAAKYATIQFFTIQTGASTWEWQAVSSIGSWVQEA